MEILLGLPKDLFEHCMKFYTHVTPSARCMIDFLDELQEVDDMTCCTVHEIATEEEQEAEETHAETPDQPFPRLLVSLRMNRDGKYGR